VNFRAKLRFGQAGESLIANWLKGARGCSVLPVYEIGEDAGKGPQVFTIDGNLIAPDLFAFGQDVSNVWWIEAKHKSAFSWHRNTQRWTTGIDLRHYEDYLRVQELSPFPVLLLFLHRNGTAKDTPEGKTSPTDRHANWGKSGMVYWAETILTKFAELGTVLQYSK